MAPANQNLLMNSTTVINRSTYIVRTLSENNITTIESIIMYYGISIATATSTSLANLSENTSRIGKSNVTYEYSGCIMASEQWYESYFGVKLAMPVWEAIFTGILLSIIIVLTIIGNIMVILSVFTYKPLRIVQNFFIVSLAIADLTVAVLVLPFNVAYSILGRWEFGIYLCKMWLTCDVMCCTSSILNLCIIALDRFWAITDPINYAQKRTVGRVLLLITGVWILSLLISSPPLVGWNDWPKEFSSAALCELNSDPGYVIYSSLGSFFIPLVIMTTVYIEIFIATRRRLRERAEASKKNTIAARSASAGVDTTTLNSNAKSRSVLALIYSMFCCCRHLSEFWSTPIIQIDQNSVSSETYDNNEYLRGQLPEHRIVVVTQRKKNRQTKMKNSITHEKSKTRKKKLCKNLPMDSKQVKYDYESAAKGYLLSSRVKNNDSKNLEISTDSGSDPKGFLKVMDTNGEGNEISDNDAESMSLKLTPPESSIGIVSLQASCLQKKSGGVYQFIEEKQKISLSKERRAARTLGIIMGVFVICWLPFFVMYVLLPFCSTCCPTTKFKNFITWLGYINSVLNPIIYTIFNLDYRRAFKRLIGLK